jgi:signal transduction histidine kinase
MIDNAAGERRSHSPGTEGESPLDAIIEHVADGIVIVAPDGIIRFSNPAAERMFGRPASDLIGTDFGFPLVREGSAEIDIVQPRIGAIVAELRMAEMEWKGEASILISLRDVTDRREAEERGRELIRLETARDQAEEEKSRFRFLAETSALLDSSLDYSQVLNRLARLIVTPQREISGDGAGSSRALADWCAIDVVEPDGSIARVAVAHQDPRREELLNELRERFPPGWNQRYPAARAIRERRATLYGDLDEQGLAALTRGSEHAALLRRIGLSAAMAVPLIARGETVGAITFARSQRGYEPFEFVLAQDLAQRAAYALANARLYREANEANRAKSDFLAVMSHELRTPLNAVMGYTDLLEAGVSGPLNERQKEQLGRIGESSRHLLRIVDEILGYARLEAGRAELQLELVSIAHVLRDVAMMIEPQLERKNLKLVVCEPERPVKLRTDPGKLRQILLNLLSNAAKFTEEGEIRLEVKSDGAAHQIMVIDTGSGIPSTALPRIFEPFWQVEQGTRRSIGGTGLGLSVASRLARLLGGSLHVESEVGKGSCFTLFLPVDGADRGSANGG